jgi:hypothetical protein
MLLRGLNVKEHLNLKNDWVLNVLKFIFGSVAFVKDEIMGINEMSKTDEQLFVIKYMGQKFCGDVELLMNVYIFTTSLSLL